MRSFFETNRATRTLYYALNGVLGLFFLIPFYWTLSTALKARQNILIYPPQIIPHPVTLANFHYVWFERPEVRGYFLNSAVVAIGTVLAVMTISTLAGYGFAKLQIPYKNLLFFSILLGLMIPHQTLIVPLFQIMQRLNLINTRLGLIVIYTTFELPVSVFLMRNTFEAIPTSMLEAARTDGASEGRVWWQIALPLALPGLVTVMVLTFIFSWNEFLTALIFTTTDKLKTVPVGIAVLMGLYGTQWEILTAVATLSFLPVIILFMLSQRFFVRAVSSGAVK